MFFSGQLSLSRTISYWQADKVLLTLVGTAFFPWMVHSFPASQGTSLGQIWLPIFWAPLVAILTCRRHVALTAVLLGPSLNHLIFGLPSIGMFYVLTFELLVFSVFLQAFGRKGTLRMGFVVLAYLVARLLAVWLFGPKVFFEAFAIFLASVKTSWPGLIVFVGLTAFIHYVPKARS